MKPKKNFIVVQVSLDQKESIKIGDVNFQLVPKFTTNFREKNPVVGVVIDGNGVIKKGTILICHHNFFRDDSPYRIYDNYFSIPIGRQIFLNIDENGEPHGMFGNILAERIEQAHFLETPASYKKNYNDRVIVLENGEGLLKGEEILTKVMADYEVVYIFNGIQKRLIRVFNEDIVAVIEK
jgi:hypothetical protein